MGRSALVNKAEDVIIRSPDGLNGRLQELGPGLIVELLLEVIRRGQQAGRWATKSHPVFYEGTTIYCVTNGELREALSYHAWKIENPDNVPLIVSPDGSVRITAMEGDHNTGQLQAPSTRRPRRAAGIRIVRWNAQLWLLEDVADPDGDDRQSEDDGATWFLLFYRPKGNDTVYSELSHPLKVSDGGAVKEYSERLILPTIDLLDGHRESRNEDDDTTPEVDVPVTRRAG